MVASTKTNDRTDKNIQKVKNISEVVAILTRQLIGETCHQVHFNYGDELCPDFGIMSPHEHPKLQHLQIGLGYFWSCKSIHDRC